MAASSAAIERTWASAAASTAIALSPVPNPPRMMLVSDRFIASAMSLVRMLPDAPTSAPATISAQLAMTNPAIATAVPVNALSSEMTTGMSAPPIGSTIITPNPSEASTTMSSAGRLAVVSMNAAAPMATTASATLIARPPRSVKADRRADQRAGDQHDPAGRGDRAIVDEQDQRGDARDHHARHGHLVAPARGARAVHQVQPDHEERRRHHVDELDPAGE